MHPELTLGPLTLSAYSVSTAAAMATVLIGGWLYARRRGFKDSDALMMLFGMGFTALIGARLFNVIVNYEWYSQEPARAFALSASGFSLYGGVVAGAAAGFLIARARRIPLLKFADTVTPFVGIGIALMRVGCFLNGCCFGKFTTLPWGVKFPAYSPAHIHQISQNPLGAFTVDPVHPTQIYELIVALVCTAIAFILLRKKNHETKTAPHTRLHPRPLPHGSVALICVIIFSAFRLLNMQLRVLPYSPETNTVWYPLFYIAIIAVSTIFMIKINKTHNHPK